MKSPVNHTEHGVSRSSQLPVRMFLLLWALFSQMLTNYSYFVGTGSQMYIKILFFLETSLGIRLMAKRKCRGWGGSRQPCLVFMLTYLKYHDEYILHSSDFLRNAFTACLHQVSETILLGLINVTACRNALYIFYSAIILSWDKIVWECLSRGLLTDLFFICWLYCCCMRYWKWCCLEASVSNGLVFLSESSPAFLHDWLGVVRSVPVFLWKCLMCHFHVNGVFSSFFYSPWLDCFFWMFCHNFFCSDSRTCFAQLWICYLVSKSPSLLPCLKCHHCFQSKSSSFSPITAPEVVFLPLRC